MNAPTFTRTPVIIAAALAIVAAGSIVAADLVSVQEPQAAPVQTTALPGDAGCILQGAPGRLNGPQDSRVTAVDGSAVGNPEKVGAIASSIRVRVPDGTLTQSPLIDLDSAAGQAWIECGSPLTSTFLQIPDTGSAQVILVNPDSSDAVVNLTMYGTDGEVVESGARGIAVPRKSTKIVPLAALAPDGTALGVKVQTSQGRVLAAARLNARGGGLDQSSGAEPATTQVVAGVPAGATTTRLIVTNPTDETVTGTLRVLGARGAFAPAGNETVEVAPLSTVVVDLSQAIRGEQVAIEVVADRGQLAATAQVKRAKDALLIPAAVAGDDLVGFGPEGLLQVVNRGSAPASVTIGSTDNPSRVTIPAGATWQGKAAAGRQEVHGNQVIATVISAKGGAMRRLHPLQTVDIAGPVQVDPTLR